MESEIKRTLFIKIKRIFIFIQGYVICYVTIYYVIFVNNLELNVSILQ